MRCGGAPNRREVAEKTVVLKHLPHLSRISSRIERMMHLHLRALRDSSLLNTAILSLFRTVTTLVCHVLNFRSHVEPVGS